MDIETRGLRRSRRRPVEGRPWHRFRPAVATLEGRRLLSTFTVTQFGMDDGGEGTLSWAINQANMNKETDTIDFDGNVFNVPRTITLNGTQLALTDTATTTISGPGVNLLTVNGNHTSRVFQVDSGASAALSRLTITGGSADAGGGLLNNGTMTLTNAAVSGNSATSNGGGLLNNGTITLTNTAVSGNSVTSNGGGLGNNGTMTLTNCTVSGNSGGGGGGLDNNGRLTLTNVTVSSNSATSGGGLLNTGALTLTNTIIAGQTRGGDILGPASGTHNLIGDGTGMSGLSNRVDGNQVGTAASPIDPLLAPLGDYGGPTRIMALRPGSPAIDAGISGAGILTTDQRSFPRAGGVDIGAFEHQGAALVVDTTAGGDGSDPGQLSLRQAIHLANVQTGADTITFSDLFNSARTITLTAGGPLALTDAAQTTLIGLGANLLTVSGNSASRVFQVDSGASAALSGLTITGGNSDAGGGLFNNGTLSLTNCVVSGNTAGVDGRGGGLINHGTMTLTNCTVSGNSADIGGGLDSNGTMTLTNCTVSGNSATLGGGLDNGGTMTLTNCTVSGNSAGVGGGGGGLYSIGTLTLINCTVSGNSTGVDGIGGGLSLASGTMTLTNCTVSGNSATTGGGLYNFYGTATVTNCTVSGNSADVGGGLDSNGTMTLTNCTVSGNSATTGGGLHQRITPYGTGALTLTNTIVAGQAKGGDIQGLASGTHNLIGDGTGMSGLTNGTDGNRVGTAASPIDARLAPLGDYGGPTRTRALLSGSPAIDAGTSGGVPNTDQRGFARTGGVDIGAFEHQGAALVVNTTAEGNVSDPGQLTLRQAVNLANVLPGADTITFSSLFNTAQTITLTIGQLALTDTARTTIDGPGSDLLSVSGNHASRAFLVTSGASAALSGLTITGGNAAFGGGLLNSGGTVTLTNCTVTGNSTTSGAGGGLFNAGTLTLTNATVSGNSSVFDGGGLYNAAGALTLTNATVSGNSAGNDGGGLFLYKGTLTLTNATVSGNSAVFDGGGLYNLDTLTLTNTTVTGNTTTSGAGGGLFNNGTLTLTNCTISGNSAAINASGLYTNDSPATLTNTIVAGNGPTNGPGRDIFGTASGTHNLVGDGTGMSGLSNGTDGNRVGTAASPVDPLLAPLGDYGGPTRTRALLPGSPAIGAGTAAGAPATDQRGRPRSGRIDIGAFQSGGFTLTPVAGSTPQSAEAGMAFAHPLAVTVTAINPLEPVDGGIIRFAAAAAGASASLSAATAIIGNGQASVTAMANATPGAYTATAAATGAASASFALTNTEARSLVLTTHRDVVDEFDGLTSLREAIAFANSHPGPDTITFHPAVVGTRPLTIRLAGGPLVLTDPATTTILGPGARRLTIQGDGRSRVVDVRGGSLALSGLTIRGGRADRGAGLRNDGGTLELTGVIIRGNAARGFGGGLVNAGRARLTNVIVRGNAARVGGGIANFGTLALNRVLIRHNFARVACGLFNSRAATLIRR